MMNLIKEHWSSDQDADRGLPDHVVYAPTPEGPECIDHWLAAEPLEEPRSGQPCKFRASLGLNSAKRSERSDRTIML